MELPQREYTQEQLELIMDIMVYEDYHDFYENYYLAAQSFKYNGWKAYTSYTSNDLIDEFNCRADFHDSLSDYIQSNDRGNLNDIKVELIARCRDLLPEFA